MATIAELLTSLQSDKATLAANIQTKGVTTSADETFTDLAAKVLLIDTTQKTIDTLVEEQLSTKLSDVTTSGTTIAPYTITTSLPTDQKVVYTYNTTTGEAEGVVTPVLAINSNSVDLGDAKRITVWQANAENTGYECSATYTDYPHGEILLNKTPFNVANDLYWGVDTDTFTWKYYQETTVKLPYLDTLRTTTRTNGAGASLPALKSRVISIAYLTMDAIMDPIFNEYVKATYNWDPSGDTSLETAALKRDVANDAAFQTWVRTNHANDIMVYCVTKGDGETVRQVGSADLLDAYIDYRNNYQIGGTTYWIGPEFTVYETTDTEPSDGVVLSRSQITTYADYTAALSNINSGFVCPVYYRSDDPNAEIVSSLVQPIYKVENDTLTLPGASDITTGPVTGWTDWASNYNPGDTATITSPTTFRALT